MQWGGAGKIKKLVLQSSALQRQTRGSPYGVYGVEQELMVKTTDNPTILYLSGTLPARSETFVYREIFALRDRGVRVITASIHPPDADLGDARLDEMARDTVGVYGDGFGAILRDVVLSALRHPLRSIGTLARGVADALFSRDVRFLAPAEGVLSVSGGDRARLARAAARRAAHSRAHGARADLDRDVRGPTTRRRVQLHRARERFVSQSHAAARETRAGGVHGVHQRMASRVLSADHATVR